MIIRLIIVIVGNAVLVSIPLFVFTDFNSFQQLFYLIVVAGANPLFLLAGVSNNWWGYTKKQLTLRIIVCVVAFSLGFFFLPHNVDFAKAIIYPETSNWFFTNFEVNHYMLIPLVTLIVTQEALICWFNRKKKSDIHVDYLIPE